MEHLGTPVMCVTIITSRNQGTKTDSRNAHGRDLGGGITPRGGFTLLKNFKPGHSAHTSTFGAHETSHLSLRCEAPWLSFGRLERMNMTSGGVQAGFWEA